MPDNIPTTPAEVPAVTTPAEVPAATAATEGAQSAQEAQQPQGAQHQPEAQTYTQADIDRILDRRHAQFEREMTQRLAQARAEGQAEAERVARMSAEERARHDAEAAQQREQEMQRREAELNRRELRADAMETLSERGLPRELERLLDYADAEHCTASIDEIERLFRSAVQAGVDARLRQGGAQQLPRGEPSTEGAMLARMRAAAGLNN